MFHSTPFRFSFKYLVLFLALIIRNRIYSCLKEEWSRLEKRPNYMTVPAAIKELEKIEMVRLTDNKYRLDQAVSSLQKLLDKRDAKRKDDLTSKPNPLKTLFCAILTKQRF